MVSNDACVTTQYGETEDYSVNIIESSLNIINSDFVNMKLYPNPTKGEFVIDFSKSINELEILIYDINGRVVEEYKLENKSRINLNPKVSAGLYFIKIISSSQSIIFKLIKK
jgi:flagellar hook assembly protein FlgD